MTFEYSDPRDNIHSECELEVHRLKEEIATLTAERDEARKGENTQCTIRYMLQDELDAVKAELAALKAGRVVETDGVNGLNSEKGVGC